MRKTVIALLTILACSSLVLAFDQVNINFTRPQNAPYFVGQPEFNIDAEEFNTVVLKIKSDKSCTARLFWATNFDPQMNQPKSIWFFVNKSDNFKEYIFNLRSQNSYWAGYVGQLAVFPENGPDGIELAPSQATVGNLGTNISSGWREFWGPRGRLVIGSTINTIQSINLFGRPIYSYVYWSLLLVTIAHSIWLLANKKFNWQEVGRAVLFALLGCWLLLEISSFFTTWLWLKEDGKYVGKSARDKYVLANTGDFYSFIEFCRANIPPEANFEIRIPPIYNDIKAIYYLSPRLHLTQEAEYLVVYDQIIEPALQDRFGPWKTFRQSAQIWRKK